MPLKTGDTEKLKHKGYRAYIIEQTIQYVVVAKSPEDAREHGAEAVRDDCFMEDSFEVSDMSHMPAGWESNCLVYGDHGFDLPASDAAKLPGGYKHTSHKFPND